LFKGCVYAQKEVSLQRHGNRSLRPGFNECGPRKLRSSAYAIYSLLMAGHPFAVILCLNTTARACELKGLKWADVDLFSRIVTIQKRDGNWRADCSSDGVDCSALARLRGRAESFGLASYDIDYDTNYDTNTLPVSARLV